jgi:WD40 repeat protein
VWDALTGELQLKFQPEHTAPITAVVVSNTGRHILTGSRDGTVKRFDVRADEGAVFAAAAKAHRFGVAGLVAHHSGDFLLSYGARDGRITVWDIESLLDVTSFVLPADTPVLQAGASSPFCTAAIPPPPPPLVLSGHASSLPPY